MGPLGPHLNQLFDTSLNCFGCILDVCVPHLVGSQPSHLQIVILHYINSHQPTVISIRLIVASRIVHMTLDNVQDLTYQNYSSVSFLPVIVECSIA